MIQAEKSYVYGAAAPKIEYDVYENNEVLKAKKKQKSYTKSKIRMTLAILAVFAACFVVIYRYALITELSYNIDKANKAYTQIKNADTTLKIAIDQEMDLNKIREIAETKLGMKKPDRYQIVCVNVPKSDFTEVADAYKGKSETTEGMFAVLMDKVDKFTRWFY